MVNQVIIYLIVVASNLVSDIGIFFHIVPDNVISAFSIDTADAKSPYIYRRRPVEGIILDYIIVASLRRPILRHYPYMAVAPSCKCIVPDYPIATLIRYNYCIICASLCFSNNLSDMVLLAVKIISLYCDVICRTPSTRCLFRTNWPVSVPNIAVIYLDVALICSHMESKSIMTTLYPEILEFHIICALYIKHEIICVCHPNL